MNRSKLVNCVHKVNTVKVFKLVKLLKQFQLESNLFKRFNIWRLVLTVSLDLTVNCYIKVIASAPNARNVSIARCIKQCVVDKLLQTLSLLGFTGQAQSHQNLGGLAPVCLVM